MYINVYIRIERRYTYVFLINHIIDSNAFNKTSFITRKECAMTMQVSAINSTNLPMQQHYIRVLDLLARCKIISYSKRAYERLALKKMQ